MDTNFDCLEEIIEDVKLQQLSQSMPEDHTEQPRLNDVLAPHVDVLKDLENQFSIEPPQWKCPKGNQIIHLCISQQCKEQSVWTCGDKECEACSSLHNECMKQAKLKVITNKLRKIIDNQKEFIMCLYQKEEEMIKKLRANRQSTIEKLKYGFLDTKYSDILNCIYLKKEKINISASFAHELSNQLEFSGCYMRNKQSFEEQKRSLLKTFDKQVKRLGFMMKNNLMTAVNGFLSINKEKNEIKQIIRINSHEDEQLEIGESSLNNSSTPQQVLKSMNTEISKKKLGRSEIKKCIESSKLINKQNTEQLNYIKNLIYHPKKGVPNLRLIFRASDNLYKASKFHFMCDKESHTLTLIKTEFGKVIGGYTPLRWGDVKEGSYGVDEKRYGFIFSLHMQQKMRLLDHTKAIMNRKGEGPIFGGGNDIYISDYCNNGKKSWTQFPKSYDLESEQLKTEQEVWTDFCGATDGCNFRVLDYEVYKASW